MPEFAPGFTLDLEPADPALEAEAVEAAKGADVVLMFLGLPEAAESEASTVGPRHAGQADRTARRPSQPKTNKNVVVVLSNGSVVTVAPWAKNAKGIPRILAAPDSPAVRRSPTCCSAR